MRSVIALDRLADRIARCWSASTASTYTIANPAFSQCSVTALVVQDHLGGMILKTSVRGQWHFYNLVDGERVDLTSSQFHKPLHYEDVLTTRKDALTDTTQKQYETMARAVESVS